MELPSQQNYHCYYSPCLYKSTYLRDFMMHLRSYHISDKSSFICRIDTCKDIFHSVSNFRRHVTNFHRTRWNERPQVITSNISGAGHSPSTNSDLPNVSNVAADEEVPMDCDSEDCARDEDKYLSLIKSLARQTVLFKLRLCYEFGIPENKSNSIIDVLTDMLKEFKSNYDMCLSKEFVDVAISDNARYMLQDNVSIDNALKITKTKEQNVLNDMGFIEPVELVFSKEGEKKECGHYIPIEKTLQNYLNREDVFASFKREHVTENLLDKMCAGTIMNDHPVLSTCKEAVRLLFYNDDFKCGNKFGANSKEHSFLGVYYVVNNIEPDHSGKLVNIHLAMLVKTSYVKKYGRKVIFQQLCDDIAKLEREGLTVYDDGVERKLQVATPAYLGDNKAQHELGGFNLSFSTGKVCRCCLTDYEELGKVHNETECVLRSVRSHDYHVQSIATDETLKSVYGVSAESVFASLKSFHPVSSLPSDIMHDLYEGNVPFNLVAVLKGLVADKILTLAEIRELFANFQYGICDKDSKHPGLPSKITGKQYSFHGTAAQKVNLFYVFTLVLGPHVPEGNKYWILHLKFLEIFEILQAPVLRPEWMPVLCLLIDEYLTFWSTLPIAVVGSVKPKMHYLIHMPRQCKIFGPLRQLSCMKFEHFHLFFKKEAESSNNYINPTYTLSHSFQKKRCLEYSSTNLCTEAEIKGTQKSVNVSNLVSLERKVVEAFFDIRGDSSVISVKEVKISGRNLITNQFVILDVLDDDIPVFLRVIHIYYARGQWGIYGKLTFPECWNDHFHAYEIGEKNLSEDFVCVSPKQIVPMQTLSSYVVDGKKYLKVRHCPVKVENPGSP